MQTSMEKIKNREIWVDNAKFIGIALMVLGHNELNNQSFFDFIYSFHMPLFFILSGYFASTKSDFLTFLKRNTKGLLLPYFVFWLINLPFTYLSLYKNQDLYPCDGIVDFILHPVFGMLLTGTTGFSYFIGPLWFFTALFLVRLLFYAVNKICGSIYFILISVIVVIVVYLLLLRIDVFMPFRLMPALLAYPFYVFGWLLRKYTFVISSLKRLSFGMSMFLVIVSSVLIVILSGINGHVQMSGGAYGNNIFLMYLVAIIGTFAVILLSVRIPENKYILTIGRGTAVVLGMHINIQVTLMRVVQYLAGISSFAWWSAILMTVFILIIHIPIINFINKYCPFIIGKSKPKTEADKPTQS